MTEKDAKNAPYVIKGTTFLCNKLVCVLINLGATFSFISSTFILHNKFELADRDEQVLVGMPIRVNVICDKVIKDVVVNIGDDEME